MALTSPTLLALRQMAFGDLQGAPQFGNYTNPPPSTAPTGSGGPPTSNPYPIPPWASNLPPGMQPTGNNVPPPWAGSGGAPPPVNGPGQSGTSAPSPATSAFARLRQSLNFTPPTVTMNDTPSDRPGGTVPVSGPGQPNMNYNALDDSQAIANFFGGRVNESGAIPGPVGAPSMPIYSTSFPTNNLGYEVDIPTAQIEHWIARGDTERDIRARLGLPV